MHRSDLDFASESGSSSMGVVGETTTSARALVPVVASDQRKAHVPTDPTALEVVEGLQDFQSVRPRLFGIAYGMLGRVADAEDVVQDVWVRWHGADRAQVRDRISFLVTMTTRVALNVAVSARARREVPVDRGLPERLPSSDDPTDAVEQSVDLEDAVRLLLERLSPTERAVFLLREAFNYPFREIAEALEISEANARQVKRRARTHLARQQPEQVQAVDGDRLFKAFLNAARIGDVASLQRVLVDDVVSQSGRRVRTHLSPFTPVRGARACGGQAVAAVPETRVS